MHGITPQFAILDIGQFSEIASHRIRRDTRAKQRYAGAAIRRHRGWNGSSNPFIKTIIGVTNLDGATYSRNVRKSSKITNLVSQTRARHMPNSDNTGWHGRAFAGRSCHRQISTCSEDWRGLIRITLLFRG
jgi:hypothetical protein